MTQDDIRTLRSEPRPIELRGLRLVVAAGPDRGLERVADSRVLRVGTSAGCDLRLTDPSVSRQHFELRVRRDGLRLLDLGSTNGTRVDGVQVHDASVTPGQQVAIGATVLRLVADDAPVRIALSERTSLGRMIGECTAMREVFALIERLGPTMVSVLIEGESGTGKELAAEALHQLSRRRGRFVVVDCSAIQSNLFESELFGHVKGAFTGALQDRRGLFEEAHGGTVFLDEIGELPAEHQAKLLRVLERGELRPVGSNRTVSVDVRIVAATNRNLASEVNAGSFREDLYYRIAGARMVMPALRDRGSDLGKLIAHFVTTFDPSAGERVPEIVQRLRHRHFLGNVRELRNAVQLALALPSEGDVAPAWTPGTDAFEGLYALPYGPASEAALHRFQRAYVRHLLDEERGNLTAAARRATMSRRYLQKIVGQLGLGRGLDDEQD